MEEDRNFCRRRIIWNSRYQGTSSKDAKKVYTSCTAAFLRAKECVMNTVSTVQENAGDIYAGAKEINEERAAKAEAEAFADAEAEAAEKTETAENTEE